MRGDAVVRLELRPAATMARLAGLLLILCRYAVTYLVGCVVPRLRCLQRVPSCARIAGISPPERLRDMFEELGGAFLKFGQMLALQPDILPVRYCNALFDLLDRVPPFPFSDVDRVFHEEFRQSALNLFDSIALAPVASASIGQVHVATMRGRKVAVKVQRPCAAAQFTSDTRLMSFAVSLIRLLRLRPLYWLIEPITEFVLWTDEELDYRCEARYMERLRRNANGNIHERVPEVLWPYVSRRILVTEFLEGDTVLTYLRSRESDGAGVAARRAPPGFDPHTVASHIIDNFLGDVFVHGMFHADLHPANLMILPHNVVGYIDFGITGTISRYSRQNIVALTLAYTRGDLAAMCAAFFRVSAIDERSTVDRFRAGLEAASRNWYSEGVGGRRLRKNFTLVMLDMLRLSRETGIFPERDVIKYIRSAIAIDGLITRLAPTFDVRSHLEHVCARYVAGDLPRAAMVYQTIAGCANSLLSLWRHGGARMATILERLAGGELPVGLEFERPLRRSRVMRSVSAAACLLGAAAATASLPPGTGEITTAELSIVACTVAVFSRRRRGALRTRVRNCEEARCGTSRNQC